MRKTDLRWLRLPALVRAVALLGEQHGGLDLDDPEAICLALGVHPGERDLFVALAAQAASATNPQTGNAARCRRRRERERIAAAMSQGMSPTMSDPCRTHVSGMSPSDEAPSFSLSLDSVSSRSFSLSAEDLPQSAGAGARAADGETMSRPMSPDHVARDLVAKRKKYSHPETQVPRVDAPPEEVEAFCAKWKIPPPSDPRVKEFLRVYRQNEKYWRNWGLVWVGFIEREKKWKAGAGRHDVQQLNGTEAFMQKAKVNF